MAERVDLDAVMQLGSRPFIGWTVAEWRAWQGMVLAMVAELQVAREVAEAVPSAERLTALIGWLDLIDKFASLVDPTYTLPRDEIQRDLSRLRNALAAYDQATGQPATADQPPGDR